AFLVIFTSCSTVAPSLTSIGTSVCPHSSCQIPSVYFPAGTFLISYSPPLPLTAKNGCDTTPMYAHIQGCTSHLTRTLTSGFGEVRPSSLMPSWGWLTLNWGFLFGTA